LREVIFHVYLGTIFATIDVVIATDWKKRYLESWKDQQLWSAVYFKCRLAILLQHYQRASWVETERSWCPQRFWACTKHLQLSWNWFVHSPIHIFPKLQLIVHTFYDLLQDEWAVGIMTGIWMQSILIFPIFCN
jgi:hypothetical protein